MLKGNYITLKPGEGNTVSEFWALDKPPVKDKSAPGLYFTLGAKKLGSLHIGSPVNFKQIKVGEVQKYSLNTDGDGVDIDIRIDNEFEHFINKGSRFWNVSGLRVSGGLSGVNLQMDSLATLIAGGFRFIHLKTQSQ